jgi:hypothetical protein
VLTDLARECVGSHDSFRSCWTRFDSWTGYSTTCLASVMDARWSSEPQDGVRLPGGVLKSTCPGSVLDSHASPRSSKIRFDSWPGHFLTLEPDGTAIGCNPIEVGSTPTGVSDQPTAGSDYIFLRKRTVSELFLRWKVATHAQLPIGTTSQAVNLVP